MPLLAGHRVVVIDVETTGWSFARDSIIEIGRVTLQDGEIAESWNSFVRPSTPVPPDATRIHGISDAMLAGAPEPRDLAGPVRDACADATLALHNASFDLPFLNALLAAHGYTPLYNPVIDTLGLARGLFGSGGNTLGELSQRLEIEHAMSHRALPDARATAVLLIRLASRWESARGIGSLDELAAASLDALRVARRSHPRPTLAAAL
jgi:DNA polymerase III epsilon subunit family exonuclease